ncbi:MULTISPECIES: dGTP triphosphohydrolase [Capnocytophaga]|jgi:deoxyguanosinetriphosphate triphosphohydrolase-like protein|uniref:dGTP triphosphohydrolase n=1 Tax=Capnocytophaga TaxID=1016 RepID=UPI00027C4495|nr:MULTISPECIES: dNTP triphosphohydrolase [Capnocytophaga]EJU31656.1 putative dGTPase [Capnocytophaga sp. CM59]
MNWDNLLNTNRLRTSERQKDSRNEFESDFGRIIFSPALRRMHDKTQVFPLTTDDNIHSRLTHSMEVMSVGYSLGVRISEDEKIKQKFSGKEDLFREIPIIMKNICLIHDIGNPPFGHFGETVIQNYFKELFEADKNAVEQKKQDKPKFNLTPDQKRDFLNFDGNAQGLRVLTKLQSLNDDKGLNLTYATLAAYIKYPNYGDKDKSRIATKKTGVFHSEKAYFEKIMEGCGLKNGVQYIRHPFCYLMEAADSICYLTMDIEDAYSKKLITLDEFYNKIKTNPLVSDNIKKIYEDISGYYKNDITKIVNFRIALIQALTNLAYDNFIKNIDKMEAGDYNEELIFDDESGLAKILQGIFIERIASYREINSLEVTGHSVIKGLLDYYIYFLFHSNKDYQKRAEQLISNSISKAIFTENHCNSLDELNDYYKLKLIVDFITGMTDQYALDHYQKISGQKIS